MSIATCYIAPVYVHASVKRRKNSWYTVKDGNWTDPFVWESNAIKRWNYPGQNIPIPIFPQVGDDVYINHIVTLNAGSVSIPIVVNNLYVAGTFKADNSSRVISVNGDIQATGSVDFTSSNVNLQLYGVNNYIVNFTSGASSKITYIRTGDQPVMDLSYFNVDIKGTGTKYLVNDLTISGALTIFNTGNTFECGAYNLTVTGVTQTQSGGPIFSKSGAGSILFIGKFNMFGGTTSLTGNPTVEMRGGYTWSGSNFTSGTGTWTFTTNNQTLDSDRVKIFDGDVIISGAITITNNSGTFQTTTSIDGTVAGSTFINKATYNQDSSTLPMSTFGVWDYLTNSTSVVGYVLSGNYTLPYTTYNGLTIGGESTKTLGGSTTVNNNLITSINTTFELSTFDLTVTGTSAIGSGILGLSKTGAGNLLFIGNFSNGGGGKVDFSVGNPTVEFRGGCAFSGSTFNSGTGTISFTTNNQTFSTGISNINFQGAVLISGAITLTFTGTSTTTFTGAVNGNNAASILDNRTIVHYKNATAPMVTGLLYCNQATNTWFYDGATNQDIQVPSDPTTPGYKNLTLAGGSFAKKLLGNVSVKGTYTLTSPATLNTNGFALTNP